MPYRVHDRIVDERRLRIRHEEREIDCTPRTFDLIHYLIRNPGRLLPRHELLDAVWSDRTVADSSLATAIKEARRALGDTREAQAVIRTVYGRGYELVAAVEELPPEGSKGPAPPSASTPPVLPPIDSEEEVTGASEIEPRGEIRHLTALVCDLVDPEAFPPDAGPETVHATLERYRTAVANVVHRFGGLLAESLGDELLAYFGYPRAHEEDALRAALAALEIREALRTPTEGPPLSVRIGIDSGEVMVARPARRGPSSERRVFGSIVNRAHRIQERAEPDTVVVSRATAELLQGAFDTETLGPVALQGFATREIHRLLRPRIGVTRLERRLGRSRTPLVGRRRELRVLEDKWALATRGQGQAVWISGEAGVGKSRLAFELRARLELEAEGVLWLTAEASPLYQQSPLSPVLELIREALSIDPVPAAVSIQTLAKSLEPLGMTDPRQVEILARTLDQGPVRDSTSGATQGDLHEPMLKVLLLYLVERARQEPIVLCIEDLHWLDPSSVELLDRLVEVIPHTRILLLVTTRPHVTCRWPDPVESLEIQPLDPRQLESLARSIGAEALPTALVGELVLRSDGIPLFVEELTRTALARLEAGRGSAPHIPVTLVDALTERLDRVPSARPIVQAASVIGRRFSSALLGAVCPIPPQTLREALQSLVAAEVLEDAGGSTAWLRFRHALICDAAYRSLLEPDRRDLHRRVARALAEPTSSGIPEVEPEIVAHHLEEAGEYGTAVDFYRDAAVRATERCAYREAIAHVEHGLGLLERLPPDTDRRPKELGLLLAQAPSTLSLHGGDHPQTEPMLRRVLELAAEVGDRDASIRALRALNSCYSGVGNLPGSIECAEELVKLSRETGDREERLLAYWSLAIPLLWRSEWTRSLENAERTLELYDRSRHPSLVKSAGADPGVGARLYAAYANWALGRPDRALSLDEEAIDLARTLDHPYSIAQAYAFAAGTHVLRREPDLALRRAEFAIELSEQRGFRLYREIGRAVRGWARLATLASEGRLGLDVRMWEPASERIATVGLPLAVSAMAHTCLSAGHPQLARACLAPCDPLLERDQPCFLDAELLRLRGECGLALGGTRDAARAELERARELARTQRALSVELRVVTSLCRLDPDGFEDALREVLARFTEGETTPDQREARALLDTLHPPAR